MMSTLPYRFDEFFSSQFDEAHSPFLTPKARRWSYHLSLKISLISSLLFILALAIQFTVPPLASFLLLLVYFLAGTPALIESIEQLCEGEINIDLLMTLAALLSVFIGSAREGALLLVLFSLAESMESTVLQKTHGTLRTLSELCPQFATLKTPDGSFIQKATRNIQIGEMIFIKTGEVVPLDGLILEGSALVTMSHLTGESIPIPLKEENAIPSGCLITDGSLLVKVTKSSEESTVWRIIELIRLAEESKPKLERFFDRFGQRYATAIISLSIFFILALPLFFGIPFTGNEGAIYRSLAFLVAASPCALIIAIPTAYLCAISSCARKGILLKGGITLDTLSTCRHIAFDKTGTLTSGKLRCTEVRPISFSKTTPQSALAIAATLEQNVIHPIAQAILDKAKLDKLPLLKTDQVKIVAGGGVEALVALDGKFCRARIGHRDFIQDLVDDKDRPLFERFIKEAEQTVALLWIEGELFAFILEDTLRPESIETIQRLQKELHMECFLLTGDHQKTADRVASSLGIVHYWADLKPENKLSCIDRLSKDKPLIMVGDGINDGPALTRADIGISMGGDVGSKTAIEASDIVLLREDLSSIPWLLRKSTGTRRIILQNLTLALSVIVLATTPTLIGWIPLWLAVILHEGGTLLVGLNSLRLLK